MIQPSCVQDLAIMRAFSTITNIVVTKGLKEMQWRSTIWLCNQSRTSQKVVFNISILMMMKTMMMMLVAITNITCSRSVTLVIGRPQPVSLMAVVGATASLCMNFHTITGSSHDTESAWEVIVKAQAPTKPSDEIFISYLFQELKRMPARSNQAMSKLRSFARLGSHMSYKK